MSRCLELVLEQTSRFGTAIHTVRLTAMVLKMASKDFLFEAQRNWCYKASSGELLVLQAVKAAVAAMFLKLSASATCCYHSVISFVAHALLLLST